ncbi:uncharacterized protein LOC123517195 [Portunus trituberculatus]|uniref:uncharacterized protein LOC123517195 n=1 Tax=Portunus trituberculatus TaxID=210409 RepID=UPI001E1CD8A5|nr:uncharacterized protein LOC123517195 [Portunus trituberculatus]
MTAHRLGDSMKLPTRQTMVKQWNYSLPLTAKAKFYHLTPLDLCYAVKAAIPTTFTLGLQFTFLVLPLVQDLVTRLQKCLTPLQWLTHNATGISIPVARTIYVSFIRSVVDYLSPALIQLPKSCLQPLEVFQNKAMRDSSSPVINVQIGGKVMKALIDTGSSYTLLTEKATKRIGGEVNTRRNPPRLQGVTVKEAPNTTPLIVYPQPRFLKNTQPCLVKVNDENNIFLPLMNHTKREKIYRQVLVNKPDGSKRMCLDYRHVNKHLATDIYPLPRLEELVEQAAGHKYYVTLDMWEAYFQILLDEESRDLTTFSDGVTLYRFRRLPFGLNCSPAIFFSANSFGFGSSFEKGLGEKLSG